MLRALCFLAEFLAVLAFLTGRLRPHRFRNPDLTKRSTPMFALKRSISRPTLRQRVKSLASSTAKILRLRARAEVAEADPGRRRLMAGTIAAAAVVPLPVFGGGGPGGLADDPIFAAIEAHKATYAAHAAACQAYSDAESRFYAAGHKHPASQEVLDTFGVTEAERRTEPACIADLEAWRAVFETRPTTVAGLLTVIRYVAQPISRWGNMADEYSGIEDEPDVFAFIADNERLAGGGK
jgi:hypothetical protein